MSLEQTSIDECEDNLLVSPDSKIVETDGANLKSPKTSAGSSSVPTNSSFSTPPVKTLKTPKSKDQPKRELTISDKKV
jgi:hypothetical protein